MYEWWIYWLSFPVRMGSCGFVWKSKFSSDPRCLILTQSTLTAWYDQSRLTCISVSATLKALIFQQWPLMHLHVIAVQGSIWSSKWLCFVTEEIRSPNLSSPTSRHPHPFSPLHRRGTKGHPHEILHWTCFLFPPPCNLPHQCYSHPRIWKFCIPFQRSPFDFSWTWLCF